MSILLEIFAPYMNFITFFITITFNLFLIIKKSNWYVIIIGNIILSLIMNFLGLGQYDLLTQIVTYIVDLIVEVISAIVNGAIQIVGSIFSSIANAIKGVIDGIF